MMTPYTGRHGAKYRIKRYISLKRIIEDVYYEIIGNIIFKL